MVADPPDTDAAGGGRPGSGAPVLGGFGKGKGVIGVGDEGLS